MAIDNSFVPDQAITPLDFDKYMINDDFDVMHVRLNNIAGLPYTGVYILINGDAQGRKLFKEYEFTKEQIDRLKDFKGEVICKNMPF